MPALTEADTIRVLVATDNHVGYNERDPTRGDDSWQTFHEIMCLAKKRDVDMVLLAGDLFHDNKPSRKAMYQVMRSLRMNCYGERPCQLEMLSDTSDAFDATFNHANYEDLDINVSMPVFSIHGNHDDPSGEGHFAALDILQVSGLINYYGRTPESDNIHVKPVLLQKGRTKLALYGLSNVRDERLYRTFRDGKVKFYKPGTQQQDWFNICSVHQNHHAYTETNYLPENFLPSFMDLVIWGHEHECLIDPITNPEMDFKVMQPGSSVATSLIPGEAVTKHVAILTITGKDFKSESIRLKTVRPFIYKDLVLNDDPAARRIAKKGENHRAELTRYLEAQVNNMIDQAAQDWIEAQNEPNGTTPDADGDSDIDSTPHSKEAPLPLIRLRVESSSADNIHFDVENPQRFSNRFARRVANVNDVIQYHHKKRAAMTSARKLADNPEEREILSHLEGLDTMKVEKLVREFLAAQSLTILPQNHFGDAVSQFIEKDDRHAMEYFVNSSLADQMRHLISLGENSEDEEEGDDMVERIEKYRKELEELFSKGALKRAAMGGKERFKPRPDDWDSDLQGDWEDQPGALVRSDDEDEKGDEDEDDDETPKPKAATRGGRGRGTGRGGRAGAAATTTRKTAAVPRKAATARRGKKTIIDSDEDEEDEDAMVIDEDEEDEDSMFFKEDKSAKKKPAPATSRSRKAASPVKKPAPRTAAKRGTQSVLNFSQAQRNGGGKGRAESIDISDDDDAFESAPVTTKRKR